MIELRALDGQLVQDIVLGRGRQLAGPNGADQVVSLTQAAREMRGDGAGVSSVELGKGAFPGSVDGPQRLFQKGGVFRSGQAGNAGKLTVDAVEKRQLFFAGGHSGFEAMVRARLAARLRRRRAAILRLLKAEAFARQLSVGSAQQRIVVAGRDFDLDGERLPAAPPAERRAGIVLPRS